MMQQMVGTERNLKNATMSFFTVAKFPPAKESCYSNSNFILVLYYCMPTF